MLNRERKSNDARTSAGSKGEPSGFATPGTGEGPLVYAERRIAVTQKLISKHGFKADRILDFGCGTGTSIPLLNVALLELDAFRGSISYPRVKTVTSNGLRGHITRIGLEGTAAPASDQNRFLIPPRIQMVADGEMKPATAL
jgi:hypothetical protein